LKVTSATDVERRGDLAESNAT